MLELATPKDDGLPTPEVGAWSRDKHHFLRRYIDAFTMAMRPKRWSALNYIDLFAGAGLTRIKGTTEYEWGSPLIAAQCDRFDEIHVCEQQPNLFDALQQRLQALNPTPKTFTYNGDANNEVTRIVARIRPRSLSLAFLDPFGLHLDYETVRVLANNRADLIIFFPDHLDALRNCEYVYRDQPNSNLDRFLGTDEWRDAMDLRPGDQWADILRDLYVQQIKKLGYLYFDFERIPVIGRPLYRLIFCSKDKAGLTIWRNLAQTQPGGQRRMTFD